MASTHIPQMDGDQELHGALHKIDDLSQRLSFVEEKIAEDNFTLRSMEVKLTQLKDSARTTFFELIPKVNSVLASKDVNSTFMCNEVSSVLGSKEGSTNERSTSPAQVASSSLVAAAASGDSESVLRLLEADADVEERDECSDTALHLAAARGQLRVVLALLGSGAALDRMDCHGRTPLHLAAVNGHESVVKRLLAAGAHINASDSEGLSPLWLAAEAGRWGMVQFLTECGADLDACDTRGRSAVSLATKAGKWEIVSLLLRKGASLQYDEGLNTLLAPAASSGQVDVVQIILRRKYNYGEDDLKQVLSRVNNATVVWAFEDAFPGLLEGDIGRWTLRQAARTGRLEAMLAVMGAGGDINASDAVGNTALHEASREGHANCVSVLLRRGANKDARAACGSTALHLASRQGKENCVRILLKAGSNAQIKNDAGETPWDVAKTEPIRRRLLLSIGSKL